MAGLPSGGREDSAEKRGPQAGGGAAARVELRPAAAADRVFLQEVYASTRAEELAVTGWSEEDKLRFLEMQFAAQDRHYRAEYPGAEFQVILAGGKAAGRLYVHRRPAEIRIMDIALLPQFRGLGIGTRLLREILREGREASRAVSIHVEMGNRAATLYARLGFEEIGEYGIYRLLEWRPGNKAD